MPTHVTPAFSALARSKESSPFQQRILQRDVYKRLSRYRHDWDRIIYRELRNWWQCTGICTGSNQGRERAASCLARRHLNFLRLLALLSLSPTYHSWPATTPSLDSNQFSRTSTTATIQQWLPNSSNSSKRPSTLSPRCVPSNELGQVEPRVGGKEWGRGTFARSMLARPGRTAAFLRRQGAAC